MECVDHGLAGNQGGYGVCMYPGDRKRTALKHRVVMAQKLGVSLDAIAGKVVRHKCDNPRCINPEHLELGSQLDNMKDAVARGRTSRRGGRYNAKLTDENVRWIKEVYKPGDQEYSQYALAKKLGVSRTTINNVLNGYAWVSKEV